MVPGKNTVYDDAILDLIKLGKRQNRRLMAHPIQTAMIKDSSYVLGRERGMLQLSSFANP